MNKKQEKAFQRLKETPNAPLPVLTPAEFEQTANTTGEMSRVLRHRPNTVLGIRGGTSEPFFFALPAYESFTTDGTAGNTETFALSNSIHDTPNTASLALWENGTRVQPDAISYTGDSFDYTDDGTGNTLHAYYISDDPAEVRIEKTIPGKSSVSQEVWSGQAHLLHQADQGENPAHFRFGTDPFERFVASDMTLDVKVKAPYTVKFRESTDGTEADNALLNIPANSGQDTVKGLAPAIKAAMASE